MRRETLQRLHPEARVLRYIGLRGSANSRHCCHGSIAAAIKRPEKIRRTSRWPRQQFPRSFASTIKRPRHAAQHSLLCYDSSSLKHPTHYLMGLVLEKAVVTVAQLVESRIVIPVVVGSSPIGHPRIPRVLKDSQNLKTVERMRSHACATVQPA